MSSPAAWHLDPTGKHDHRWWDGTKWTEHVADAGESKIDHLPGGEAPPPPSGDLAPPTAGTDTAATGGEPGATTESGAGGLAGAWEGTAQPEQPQWQQPGAGDPNATAQQPAWQQGAAGHRNDPDAGYGQPPTWEQSGQYGQPATTGSDGVAIAALVIGILSLLTSWFVLGGLGGIVALVLGIVALGRIKRNRSGGRGMAITGIVTGVLSILVAVAILVFSISIFGEAADDYTQCLEQNTEEVCMQQLEEGIMDRFRN